MRSEDLFASITKLTSLLGDIECNKNRSRKIRHNTIFQDSMSDSIYEKQGKNSGKILISPTLRKYESNFLRPLQSRVKSLLTVQCYEKETTIRLFELILKTARIMLCSHITSYFMVTSCHRSVQFINYA